MMNTEKIRPWVVRWMYAVAIGHFLTGALLPWIGDLSMFDGYHHGIESAFWNTDAPVSARAQQVWWISLFGPTVQSLSLWMGALICIGDRQRNTFAWGFLMAGLMVWAPQDVLISLRAGAWVHVWIDSFAIATMLPPLAWLWWQDRKQARMPVQSESSYATVQP
jgi:hypothetical protein